MAPGVREALERDSAGDRRDSAADLRDRDGVERDQQGEERDDAADVRDDAGNERDDAGNRRDDAADVRDNAGNERDAAGGRRDLAAQSRDDAATLAESRLGSLPAQSQGDSAAQLARMQAAQDRNEALLDRLASTSERTSAGQDRERAFADRGAGARDRGGAEHDRGTASDDRSAGAVARTAAGHDRGFACTDRSAAEHNRVKVAKGIRFRMGLAADNAELYARQRSFSAALQRSLLTVPPRTSNFEIAVRYVPATREEEVGGDWYDAFALASGDTMIAIGDVMGHDIHAAMAMAQFRGLLRGIGFTTGETPVAVLTRLDQAVAGLGIATMATAIVARLERHREPGGSEQLLLRWSNAGHPPALVKAADGQVRALGCGQDLLLGVEATSARHENVEVLEPGSTVLLYTDGLVERRGQHLDDGIAYLMRTFESLSSLDLEQLCDEVLIQLLPEFSEDDVALLAVRVRGANGQPTS